MMKGYIYTVYDEVAGEYAPLFTAVNDAAAIRAFRNLLKSVPDKSDFKLRCLGYYDLDDLLPDQPFSLATHILLEEPREMVLDAITGQMEASGEALKTAAGDVIDIDAIRMRKGELPHDNF